jgi:HK97 family phage major capsid protein
MDDLQDVLTIEGRRSRIDEIKGRLQDMAREYAAAVMPHEAQKEWNDLVKEREDHVAAVEAHDTRATQLAAMEAGSNGNSHDRPMDVTPQPGRPAGFGGAPAVHIPQDNIYDIAAIRNRARNITELPGLYRDNAMRAIEVARFPGTSREDAQTNVARLLDTVPDDTNGVLARRILATGSPGYKRVFGRALAVGNPGALGGHDAQILALGESDTGAYAVPFELDPTVILTSNGAINPLRQISRVEQITGKEFDLVTSTGVTVHRRGEFGVSSNDAPTLTQPTIKPERVDGFIPFSVEIEGDWAGLQASMMRLLADAKDVEEASGPAGFVLGNGTGGTAPQAGGIITTLGTASQIKTAGTAAAFGVADVYATKNAVPPRFRARGSFLAETSTYDLVRQFGTGTMANVWVDLGGGRPPNLIGYPARELSSMDSGVTSAHKIMLFGDYQQFLIVDRIGMSMELVPHVADPTTGYPTGTRGYYVWWRNNSVVLVPNAFRVLVVGP